MKLFGKIIPFKALAGQRDRRQLERQLQQKQEYLAEVERLLGPASAAVLVVVTPSGAASVQFLAKDKVEVLGVLALGKDVICRALGSKPRASS